MIYAIIIIVTAVAIFLIFRYDHDDSYNKNEKGHRKEPKTKSQPKQQQTNYQKEASAAHKADAGYAPRTEKKTSGPTLKEQILADIEHALTEAKKGAEEPMKIIGDAMSMAKEAMKEAQKGWNTTGTQTDVDEQFPEDEEV